MRASPPLLREAARGATLGRCADAQPPASRALTDRRDMRGSDLENSKCGLEPFEVAQLGNLCPQDPQEARALIPSLDMPGRDINDAQLAELLDQLNAFKQYNS